MTGDAHPSEETDRPVPWHNSTGAVVAASVVGLALIAALVAGGMFIARQIGEPEQAPLNFVDPSFTPSEVAPATATTTTETITSTSPPATTDINPPSETTSGTETTTSGSETETTTRTPRTSRGDDETGDDDTSTTRRRPRLNETRILNPPPQN
ncbi:MAG: hypothetical protein JST91_28710 [Actinobacteria bacterium]|nr:hypothetical protein [Actinomycetota bacterium]